jgi:glycosyltransferase involved in cell wall biosynthesis
MKNIAIVIDALTGGGAEKVMLTLGQAFIELGHAVTILSLGNKRDYHIPVGIDDHCLFDHKASKVDRFWHINSSVKKLETWFAKQQQAKGAFDLILSNLDRSNNLLSQSNINDVFFIVHNSINEELARQQKLGPLAYRYLKKSKQHLSNQQLIAVSKGIEQEVIDSDFIKQASITTIYNPFDIDDMKRLAAQENKAIPNEPYIIHVGRMAKQKRHDVLFQAFKNVPEKYRLVLLCNNPKKALKLAEQYGIAKRLILPGFQTNPYNWIKKAELLVLSSDYEGFGNVLAEALIVGTKVVSTQCPHGPDEILTGCLSDYLVPRRDASALANAMNKALLADLPTENIDIIDKVASHKIAKQYLSLIRRVT